MQGHRTKSIDAHIPREIRDNSPWKIPDEWSQAKTERWQNEWKHETEKAAVVLLKTQKLLTLVENRSTVGYA